MKIKDEILIEAKKQDIINIAEKIITTDGIEQLSIRKIAKVLNQTPGIIYHYFLNKDEIILAIVKRGYDEIVELILKCAEIEDLEMRIHDTIYFYIKLMLRKDKIFLILMQSEQKQIQECVNVLQCDMLNRKSLQSLYETIQKGNETGIFACPNVELRVRTIWTSVYGLISRLIVESVNNDLIDQLIEDHLYMIIKSLKGETI